MSRPGWEEGAAWALRVIFPCLAEPDSLVEWIDWY
jgi:hypothetical protein